jgi:hypothetical protein
MATRAAVGGEWGFGVEAVDGAVEGFVGFGEAWWQW